MTLTAAPPAGALSALADPALVALVVGGSATAFETLDRRHRPTVLRQCACLLRSSHDAEEATQQAMFSAYRALAAGKVPKSFPAWLTTIARNECFDMIRARRGVEPLLVEVAAGGETLPERVERRERIDTLKRDLVELPEAQRRALVLRGVGDLSHAEIARLLGGTPTEMRTLVHEARSSLAEFEAGRELDCDMVRERISSGDGRALRARRVRAHLRACESCAIAAGRHTPGLRRGLGALLPFPIFGAIRAALFGGGAGVAGPVGVVAVSGALVASVVIGIGGGVGGGALASDSAPAATTGQAVDTAATGSAASPATAGGSTRTRTATRSAAAGSAPAAAGGSAARSSATSSTPTPTASAAVSTVGLPSVRVPPVTAPSAGVPSVRVPSVAIPPATVPSVAVPPVTTPAVPIVGSVTTPPVVTPQVVTPPLSTPQIVVPPIQVPPVQVPPLVP